MDYGAAIGNVITPVLGFLSSVLSFLFGGAFVLLLLFFGIFFARYGGGAGKLRSRNIRWKPYDFTRWLLVDFLTRKERAGIFDEYGFTIYAGPQGAGKTISMVHYLGEMRRNYPNALIVANFDCQYADMNMTDWRDLFDIRNDTDGVIFAIDEIHSEYSSAAWKDFPESILSEISQQRKQRIKIVATAQVFGRVAKPIREQTATVCVCRTLFGRLTTVSEYDAAEYAVKSDSAYSLKRDIKPLRRRCFVQSDALRSAYDTYAKIERLKGREFIPRGDR